jgi:flagellar basal body rod protein FlgG
MVDLVTISRAYEANQKIITSTDDRLDKTIQAFG